MAEYINKEDALDVFESIIHSLNENRFKSPSGLLTELYGKIHGVGLCRDIIRNAPTIDAVPVVRCKDCKCWTEWSNGTGSCSRFALDWIGTDADDFCSMGERKDDEDR